MQTMLVIWISFQFLDKQFFFKSSTKLGTLYFALFSIPRAFKQNFFIN